MRRTILRRYALPLASDNYNATGNRSRRRQSRLSLIARPSMIHPGFSISLCASVLRFS